MFKYQRRPNVSVSFNEYHTQHGNAVFHVYFYFQLIKKGDKFKNIKKKYKYISFYLFFLFVDNKKEKEEEKVK